MKLFQKFPLNKNDYSNRISHASHHPPISEPFIPKPAPQTRHGINKSITTRPSIFENPVHRNLVHRPITEKSKKTKRPTKKKVFIKPSHSSLPPHRQTFAFPRGFRRSAKVQGLPIPMHVQPSNRPRIPMVTVPIEITPCVCHGRKSRSHV